MKYFIHEGVRIYPDFRLLFKGFLAITLFGRIYSRWSERGLKWFLNTNNGKKFINHEKIHMAQAESFKHKYWTFYSKYLGYWFINLFKYGPNKKAYYNVPFEREAYANEGNFNYLEVYPKSHWKAYK